MRPCPRSCAPSSATWLHRHGPDIFGYPLHLCYAVNLYCFRFLLSICTILVPRFLALNQPLTVRSKVQKICPVDRYETYIPFCSLQNSRVPLYFPLNFLVPLWPFEPFLKSHTPASDHDHQDSCLIDPPFSRPLALVPSLTPPASLSTQAVLLSERPTLRAHRLALILSSLSPA